MWVYRICLHPYSPYYYYYYYYYYYNIYRVHKFKQAWVRGADCCCCCCYYYYYHYHLYYRLAGKNVDDAGVLVTHKNL